MNANDLFKTVMQLDLNPIKIKLMHVESGEGWGLDKANAVEKEYRRFLCLMKLFPEEATAPLVDVDTFWHYHILDTMKYAADCEQVFGYFLHHYPYVGLHGEDDEQFRLDSGMRMRELYESLFGEAYPGARAEAALTTPMTSGRQEAGQAQLMASSTTAWCAGPAAKNTIQANGNATAWCAGPAAKNTIQANGNATAWCAGPAAKNTIQANGNATAWCAGPAAKNTIQANGNATAWCAGPAAKNTIQANGNATAWCAGPARKEAPRPA
jgi:hypothetical protein